MSERNYAIQEQRVKNTAKLWDCEVEDITKVPREFLVISLNKAAVLAAARGGVTNIPGVKLIQKTNVRFGARTAVSRRLAGRVS
jgi:hypothetical protein